MGTIKTAIALYDGVTSPLASMTKAMNIIINSFEAMQKTSCKDIDVSALQGAREEMASAQIAFESLEEKLKKPIKPTVLPPKIPDFDFQEIKMEWFDANGIQQYRQELQAVEAEFGRLAQQQQQLQSQASKSSLFPPSMAAGIDNMGRRVEALRQSLAGMSNQGASGLGFERANHDMEALCGKLAQAVQLQGTLNDAMSCADIGAANEAYEKLNRLISSTEKQVEKSTVAQQKFNGELRAGGTGADTLMRKIKGIAATIGGMLGLQKVLGLSDELAGAKARLSLIVDDGGSVEGLEKKIMQSAQRSRADYLDTLQSVSKLGLMSGDTFQSNDEMIRFSELMNKNFAIGGASAQEQSAAIYQLNQAMASGRLQGDEYRSIIENAPLLAQSIEDYMRNVKGAQGSMKDWASQGLLTAEVIKGALFSSAEEIDARFEQMPKTWAQIWTGMKNSAIAIFSPILTKISEIANSTRFTTVTDGIVSALAKVGTVATGVFDMMISIGSGIVDNWSWIEPIVRGLAAAFIAYNVALAANSALTTINGAGAAIQAVHQYTAAKAALALSKAMGVEALETTKATVAQAGFNTVLLACPITWILLAVAGLVTLFYAAVAAVNHFTGTTYSATGIICGLFTGALAFLSNLFLSFSSVVVGVVVFLCNIVADLANFVGNVFRDPIGAAGRLFAGLVDSVLGMLQSVAVAIDTVFGSHLADSVRGWRDGLSGWVEKTLGEGIDIVAKVTASDMDMGRSGIVAAFQKGDQFGRRLEGYGNKVGNGVLAAGGKLAAPREPVMDISGIYANTADIAGNTAAMSNSLEIRDEDLTYLRDIAEREAINRFTTAEIKVEMTNHNNISKDTDLDGIMDVWVNNIAQKLDNSSEGVHE